MKIEVGNVYEAFEDKAGINSGDLVMVQKVKKGYVSFRKDGDLVPFRWEIGVFKDAFNPYESKEEPSKPAHYDTEIDTLAFAKANFSREQVEGFMRINAIKYLQRAGKKDDKLSDLRKSAHYLQMLIEMEEEKDEN